MNITKHNGRPLGKENMLPTEDNTYAMLDELGIDYTTLSHEAAHTMEECAEVEKALGAIIPKNLFLCNRQQTQFYLLMMPGDKVFKTKFLSSELGCARLSFASEEHMVSLLGIHPGAVSPMGLMNDHEKKVLFVIDRELLEHDFIGCHPCVNTATIKLALSDVLNRFAERVEHEVRVVDLKTEEV